MGVDANTACPCCASTEARVFFSLEEVPVNGVLLLPTREEALAFPTGELSLGHCSGCGLVYNRTFDSRLLEYSERCEETQTCSPTFNHWLRSLAEELVARYGLESKSIIEIGCGKGEFLRLLCEAGENRGLGFDPAYVPGREGKGAADVSFIRDFYGEKYAHLRADFICCRMTLEHIAPALDFVRNLRRAVGDRLDTGVFFQVPNVLRILSERAFWDIYYEHCNYFSTGSLARLFRAGGFDVTGLQTRYGDQYIILDAQPRAPGEAPRVKLALEDDRHRIAEHVAAFEREVRDQLDAWNTRLAWYRDRGLKAVLWGSGSKGVAFLTALPNAHCVTSVVDVNPKRRNHFMAKTGHRIVGPDDLVEERPDVVIVMNPMYLDEIQGDLGARNLAAEVVTASFVSSESGV